MSGARDQVGRLLALAPYLQARGAVPLSQVAEDFGVPARQVVRDLKVLWMCGLPGLAPGDYIDIDMEALEEHPDGLVRIANAEYLSRPVRLGSAEAAALIVALRTLRDSGEESSRAVVDRTLAKLEEAAATGGVDVGAHVAVHPPDQPPELARHRAQLERAVETDRQVLLQYYVPTRDETTQRTVDPIAVLRSEGNDYLDAWCHQAGGRRLFRLSRVHGVQVLRSGREKRDVEPRDLAAGLFEPGPDDAVARVRLDPGLRWFVDHYPVTATTDVGGGVLEAELRVGDPMWLVRLALRLGPGLQVLEPAEVRQLVAETARATRELYRPRTMEDAPPILKGNP